MLQYVNEILRCQITDSHNVVLGASLDLAAIQNSFARSLVPSHTSLACSLRLTFKASF